MKVILLRLLPDRPVSAARFEDYLEVLTVSASDLRPDGTTAFLSSAERTTANVTNRIYQHVQLGPTGAAARSVATAVIEIPAGVGSEYLGADLQLEVTRDGRSIGRQRIEYNADDFDIPTIPQLLAIPTTASIAREPPAAFLTLTEPGREVDPADAYVELPSDGSPPNFADLLGAVSFVRDLDPGPAAPAGETLPQRLARARGLLLAMTNQEVQQVAKQIAYNRRLEPLPTPQVVLEDIYTDGGDDTERQKFEGKLIAYYATHDAIAERLTGYILALQMALQCEALSSASVTAGVHFPVLLTPSPVGKVQTSLVILQN